MGLLSAYDCIVIARTINKEDDAIEDWCKNNEVACFRGSENDVLNCYYCASISFPSEVIVRVTADDPFKEPCVIDSVTNVLLTVLTVTGINVGMSGLICS